MDKSYTWVRTTVDRCLSKTQTLLHTVIITPHKTKCADITIYNGESTTDEQVIYLCTGDTASKVVNFDPPLYLDRGLYVDIGGDVDDCLIQFTVGNP